MYMALINCRKCGNLISDQSETCVHCKNEADTTDYIAKRCPQCDAPLKLDYCTCCGYSVEKVKQARRKSLTGLIAITAVIAVLATISTNMLRARNARYSPQREIMLAQFDKIENGMTYDEVYEIMDGGNLLITKSDTTGQDTGTVYVFMESAAAGVVAYITFREDMVTLKAHVILD